MSVALQPHSRLTSAARVGGARRELSQSVRRGVCSSLSVGCVALTSHERTDTRAPFVDGYGPTVPGRSFPPLYFVARRRPPRGSRDNNQFVSNYLLLTLFITYVTNQRTIFASCQTNAQKIGSSLGSLSASDVRGIAGARTSTPSSLLCLGLV